LIPKIKTDSHSLPKRVNNDIILTDSGALDPSPTKNLSFFLQKSKGGKKKTSYDFGDSEKESESTISEEAESTEEEIYIGSQCLTSKNPFRKGEKEK
jgi:hypothetical protein